MIEEIQNIIDKLDLYKDALLIGLLEAKIKELHQIELSKVSINDYDMYQAIKGANRTLSYFEREFYENQCIKEKDILVRVSDCESCKNANVIYRRHFNREYTYKESNSNSDVCNQCYKRQKQIEKYIGNKTIDFPVCIETFLKKDETQDILKCKAIINKISHKLKEKTK